MRLIHKNKEKNGHARAFDIDTHGRKEGEQQERAKEQARTLFEISFEKNWPSNFNKPF